MANLIFLLLHSLCTVWPSKSWTSVHLYLCFQDADVAEHHFSQKPISACNCLTYFHFLFFSSTTLSYQLSTTLRLVGRHLTRCSVEQLFVHDIHHIFYSSSFEHDLFPEPFSWPCFRGFHSLPLHKWIDLSELDTICFSSCNHWISFLYTLSLLQMSLQNLF